MRPMSLEEKVATLAQFGSVFAESLDDADAICRLAVSRGYAPGIKTALSWKTGVADYVVEIGPEEPIEDTI